MGLRFMEHILILTDDPDATRDWWVDTLGFTEGEHPDFGFPVHWLCIGDQDVVHIGQRQQSAHQARYLATPDEDAGAANAAQGAADSTIDHVCFNCEGMADFIARLDAHGVSYSERHADGAPLYQLFMREPINGIKVELNFPIAEAVALGRVPGRTSHGATDIAA
ncbi:MAG: VOC family protein [Proteobacteria bacterium]|nr:VOC family protein [Pseudomonadota bacterium]